ncbi:ThiF family adenylyltransferase, partial [Staphylococcus haemolyticus]|uniref:ThiF family adenylyltransferase n=1 Tax=Staphylococcus haemolyticus TaxID=1283 RepID=UPI00374EEC23
MRFCGFGEEGEDGVCNGKLVMLGGGGLGSDVGEVVARMGGHEMRIVDMDIVERC